MAAELTCVRGYHVYQSRWTAVIWEELTCCRESANASNPFAAAVPVKGSEIVGHVPRFYSCILLHRGGSLFCCTSGNSPVHLKCLIDAVTPCSDAYLAIFALFSEETKV